MSHRVEIVNDKTGAKTVIPVIAVEADEVCELCGAKEETRPYGPGGKRICFSCAMKDVERTEHNFGIQLLGKPGTLQ